MTPHEIIKNHIRTNRLQITPEEMGKEVNAFKKLKGAHIAQEGDCLFLYMANDIAIQTYIINGGSSMGYLRALKKFVQAMKKANAKRIQIRVQDQNSAANIGRASGGRDISFEETNPGETDPFTMTMEI
jgi:CHASE3 domain sensor protein